MTTAQDRLNQILPSWTDLLSQWSLDGSLVAAATDALMLESSNAKQDAKGQLQSYVSQWSAGNFQNLPQIVLLSAEDISGALGAYADSTDTIYLNQDWLLTATEEEVQKVLTEELGHFLDDQLNQGDTQGDEGEEFVGTLIGVTPSEPAEDNGEIVLNGTSIPAEFSSISAEPSWIKEYGSFNYEDSYGTAIASDGKIWTATAGRYLLDGQTKTNDSDNYITIFNSDGSVSSSIYAGPISTQIIQGLTSQGDNVYVAGQTRAGTLDGQVNSWGKTGYLTAYNTSGAKLWTRLLPGYTGTRSVTSDESGIYVAGFTYFGLNGQPSLGGADAFLAKYSSSGALLWTATIGGNGDDANGGTNQISGNGTHVAVAGYTNRSIDGQPETSGGFVSFFNGDGTKLWTRMRTDGIGPVHVSADGSVYISGSKAGTTDFYIAKLDSSGNQIWSKNYGTGGIDSSRQLSINKEGELLVLATTTGAFAGFANSGDYDHAFLKVDTSSGDVIEATQWGASGRDVGTQFAQALDGSIYLAGTTNYSLPNNSFLGGTNDAYLARFNLDNPPVIDTLPPVFISGETATAIDENLGTNRSVYLANATDQSTVVYSIKPSTGDADAFSIDASNGDVTLIGNPDYETKPSYSFTVIATDAAGNSSEQTVALSINNVDEVAPSITSGAVAPTIDENSGNGQVIYTVTSDDSADVSGGVTYSINPSTGDADAFSIDASNGDVTLIGNPDYETKPSYSFTVIATDAAGNSSEQTVALQINEVAPPSDLVLNYRGKDYLLTAEYGTINSLKDILTDDPWWFANQDTSSGIFGPDELAPKLSVEIGDWFNVDNDITYTGYNSEKIVSILTAYVTENAESPTTGALWDTGLGYAVGDRIDNSKEHFFLNATLVGATGSFQLDESDRLITIDSISSASIGEASSDLSTIIVSGDLTNPVVESVESITTGKGRKKVTTTILTDIPIDPEGPVDALVVNGGEGNNNISGQGFADDPNTDIINESRSAFAGVLVIDGKGGADTIIGGASGTNWLIGGGTADGTVDTLTGVALATDIFDLRKDIGGSYEDAYGTGSATINGYDISDYIVLSNEASAYSVNNVTETIERTNKRGKVIGVDTFTKFEIRDAATENLIATVNGSTFTASSSASDLKIIYGQNTQDPFSVDLLGSGAII